MQAAYTDKTEEVMHMDSMFRLTNKTALVTGAGQGIGAAFAQGLAAAGANVAVADINLARAEETAAALEKSGVKALALQADVTKATSVETMTANIVEKFGAIDILINNAGINIRDDCTEMKEEDWDAVINVNLKGTFLCSKYVGKVMMAQNHGKVINLASMMSAVAQPKRGPYAASKGGVVQFTKVLALEWAPYHINVNAIGPGYVITDINKDLMNDKETYDYFTSKIPLGRWSTTDDLIGTVVFLSSGASDYITGQVIYVDGGFLCL